MLAGPSVLDLAHDVIRERLSQAADDALAAQLRASQSRTRPASAARLRLANGLRHLASRLDPTLVYESRLAIAKSR